MIFGAERFLIHVPEVPHHIEMETRNWKFETRHGFSRPQKNSRADFRMRQNPSREPTPRREPGDDAAPAAMDQGDTAQHFVRRHGGIRPEQPIATRHQERAGWRSAIGHRQSAIVNRQLTIINRHLHRSNHPVREEAALALK